MPTDVLCATVSNSRTKAGYKERRCIGAAAVCTEACQINAYFKRDMPGIVHSRALAAGGSDGEVQAALVSVQSALSV